MVRAALVLPQLMSNVEDGAGGGGEGSPDGNYWYAGDEQFGNAESTVAELHLRAGNKLFRRKTGRELWPVWRRRLAGAFETKLFDTILGLVIFSNILVMCVETDKNADCEDDCAGAALYAMNIAYICFYSVECLLRIAAYRGHALRDMWTLLDIMIVLLGWIELVLSEAKLLEQFDVNINFLRIFRVSRLMRATRVLRVFPELHAMILGFASAMMAMFWGFMMILGMLLFWSIFAVEFVHPVNKLAYHEDEWCVSAFRSVSSSILIFFQTLVAGDSWGHCAVPIIREYPALFLIFSLSLVSVQLGFTNLILSTIVDSASKAREEDKEFRAAEAKRRRQEATNVLLDLLVKIDTDESGAVSLEELEDGYHENHRFQQILQQLGLGPEDLRMLFAVMDVDRTGAVSYFEFIDYINNVSADQLQQHLLLARLFGKRDDIVETLLHGVGIHPSGMSTRHSRYPPGSARALRSTRPGSQATRSWRHSVAQRSTLVGSSSISSARSEDPSSTTASEPPRSPRSLPGARLSVPVAAGSMKTGRMERSPQQPPFPQHAAHLLQPEIQQLKDNQLQEELTKFQRQMEVRHAQVSIGLGQVSSEFHACVGRLAMQSFQPRTAHAVAEAADAESSATAREILEKAGVYFQSTAAPAVEDANAHGKDRRLEAGSIVAEGPQVPHDVTQKSPRAEAKFTSNSGMRIFIPHANSKDGPSPGVKLREGKSTPSASPLHEVSIISKQNMMGQQAELSKGDSLLPAGTGERVGEHHHLESSDVAVGTQRLGEAEGVPATRQKRTLEPDVDHEF